MSNTVQSDKSLFVNLPNAVANAILQDASRRLEDSWHGSERRSLSRQLQATTAFKTVLCVLDS